jgi:hypothetical protein
VIEAKSAGLNGYLVWNTRIRVRIYKISGMDSAERLWEHASAG